MLQWHKQWVSSEEWVIIDGFNTFIIVASMIQSANVLYVQEKINNKCTSPPIKFGLLVQITHFNSAISHIDYGHIDM